MRLFLAWLFVLLFAGCKSTQKSSKSEFSSQIIEMPSNLSSGYMWQLPDTSGVSIIDHTSKSNPNQKQSNDIEVFNLKPKRKGAFPITFYKKRPFDPWTDSSQLEKQTIWIGEE